MNTIAQEISHPDFDLNGFVDTAIQDKQTRDEIIRQMVTNQDIMVYYHCYYVIAQASADRPDMFYAYWPEMAALLDHHNSYHRNIGLEVIANLTRVDEKDLFSGTFARYFQRIGDEKLLTCQYCIRGSQKILKHKPHLKDQILPILLDLDNRTRFEKKKKDYLKGDVLDILADNINDEAYRSISIEFILS
ncbi:MAG TPA: hypothetical protein VN376_03930, partial [Longilinea sp.]|nr:hypothetical protein [Longilinea sp.]